MSRPAKYRPIVLIRRALLVGLALFMGVVVAIFIDNRRTPEPENAPVSETGLSGRLADVILSGKGFDYEVTEGEKRLFNIRAARIVTDRDNVVSLEGVELTVERESGAAYKLSAETGRYDTETNTARVEGGVVLSGPDGVELRSDRFDLLRKGTVVRSRSPVQFVAGGGLSGSAQEVEGHLDKDRFQLAGRVRIIADSGEGSERLSLTAKRVLYEKDIGQIHAEGGVIMRRGRDRLTSQRIAVTLDENSRPSFVRARWEVRGLLVSNDERGFERLLRLQGDQLSLAYDETGKELRLLEVIGTPRGPARFEQTDETGLVRRFVTGRIEADFSGGQPREVRTGGSVIVIDFLAFDPENELGRACANSANARFGAGGDLVRLRMAGNVDLHRPGLQTTGDRLSVLGDDLIEVDGAPAHVYTGEGELSAPKLAYRTKGGSLEASEGVWAWFPPDGDFTMVGAGGGSQDKPIQITSQSAEWTGADGKFQFDGDVRAWQGESFLTASRLLGLDGGRLRGEGGIKTVLERKPPNELPGPETESPEEPERGPVEVTAESVDYSKTDGRIEYRGGPEVRDAGRFMSCDELDVLLGDNSSLSSLRCSGNALVDDRIAGKKVRGAEALYQPGDSKVEVSGNPVTLEGPDGAEIKAGRVIYYFETATAQFLSGSSSVAPETAGDSEVPEDE